MNQALDQQAIARHYAERLVERGDSDHNDVFEDIVVAAEAADVAAVTSSDGADGGGEDEGDDIVFVDRDEEAAKWEREQIAKEPQRWEALPVFNPVRTRVSRNPEYSCILPSETCPFV